MSKIVICNSVGNYTKALTRGKEYEVLEVDEEKQQIKIIGDNKRTRWYKDYCFVPYGNSVPIMVDWKFDDVIRDSSEKSLQHPEITVSFSNGQKRWCTICTKAGLIDYIQRNMDLPVLLIESQIIVKNFSNEVVHDALVELDQQNQLIQATRFLNEQEYA
ncbi:hypothetical protein [Brevibacillus sp. SYSU BS000544]|uniref:hypothetical protein n=1 Tax=Brevibacillus sp. SYSU BS000544 TaxID=3416443 RepID=UPI003CE53DE8